MARSRLLRVMRGEVVMGDEILYPDESYALVGAAIEVRKELGLGLLEPIYQEAYAIVLEEKGIPFVREAPLSISFRGRTLTKKYFADFLCYGKIVLEFKAAEKILPVHEAQLLNYLKCTGYRLGLLFNFGPENFSYVRLANG